MAKNKFRKQALQANEIAKGANKQLQKVQCNCPHKDDGYDSLQIITKGTNRAFKCTACGKIIAFVAPGKVEIEDAANTMDTALDYMKICINTESEKGKKTLELIAQTQMALRKLTPAYIQVKNNAESKEGKKNKKGSRGSAILNYD